MGHAHSHEQCFLPASDTHYPCRDTVDAGIKVVQSHVYSLQGVTANDLLGNLLGLVIQHQHMVGIPADTSGNVQGDLRIEAQKGRNLIRNHFCRMVVAVVHKGQAAFVGSCKAKSKLCTSCGVSFHADTEYLGLYAGFYQVLVKGLRQNRFDRLFITHSGTHSVSGHIFQTVTNPDVHDAGHTGLLRKILGNADTCFTVLDPEFSGLLIRTGQGHTIFYFLMREEGGVEVDTHISLFGKLYPFLKVLGLQLISVHIFAGLEDRIACV